MHADPPPDLSPGRRLLTTEVTSAHVYDIDGIDACDPTDPPDAVFSETEQAIALDSVPQAFGGVRWFYVCPCGRRCQILYLRNDAFRCRTCHRLAYPSQNARRRRRFR
jgi:hypothetical protein